MYLEKKIVYVSEISEWSFLERYVYYILNKILMLEIPSEYYPKKWLDLSIREIFLGILILLMALTGWVIFPIIAVKGAFRLRKTFTEIKWKGYYTKSPQWVLKRGAKP